jgi:hypothetical protein
MGTMTKVVDVMYHFHGHNVLYVVVNFQPGPAFCRGEHASRSPCHPPLEVPTGGGRHYPIWLVSRAVRRGLAHDLAAR